MLEKMGEREKQKQERLQAWIRTCIVHMSSAAQCLGACAQAARPPM